MKRIVILTITLLTLCITISAQNSYGCWETIEKENNNLKGIKKLIYYVFREYHFLQYKYESPTFLIGSDSVMCGRLPKHEYFISSLYIKDGIHYVNVLISIYNKQKKLIIKYEIPCKCSKDYNTFFIYEKQNEILNALKGDGYVRIVAENYDFIINNFSTPFGEQIKNDLEMFDDGNNPILNKFGIKGDIIF